MTGILWIAMSLASGDADKPQAVPLKDGDRIVLVGDTLIEREQYYGHFETTLLCMYPELKLTFRNLGWSGDTPAGLSRCYFDPPEVGFQRLVEQIKACQPTVLIIGYGMAHALEFGDEQLFTMEMNKLLDAVVTPGMRLILVRPLWFSATALNRDMNDRIARYTVALDQIAEQLSARVACCWGAMPSEHYQPDGITLSAKGNEYLAGSLTLAFERSFQDSDADKHLIDSTQFMIGNRTLVQALQESATAEFELAVPGMPPATHKPFPYFVGLPRGNYEVRIGDEIEHQTPKKDDAKSVSKQQSPWKPQLEELRQLVIRKNALYFQRYRPQNITYLLGFRAHEQGQNAKEIEALDPMIAELEKKIDELKVPKPLKVKITRVK